MTRSEYLSELASHLISLPKEERDMAVNFYEEYFEEAGSENEQAVIDDLGKPFNLARSIIGETSLYSKSTVYLQYKESKPMPQNNTSVFASLRKPDAFENVGTEPIVEGDIMPDAASEQDIFPNAKQDGMFDADYIKDTVEQDAEPKQKKKSMSTGMIVFLIILAIIIGLPIAVTLISIVVALFGVMAIFGIVSIVCIILAIITFIVGLTRFAVSVPSAIGYICTSILVAGIGMVLLSASIVFFFKLLPFTYKGIKNLFSKKRAEV